MQHLLSICIPTYNRADYLAENISVIAEQLDYYKDNVEFVISDNCSNDHTKEIVLHLKSSFNLNLKYYIQERPLSFEDNFDFVVDKSQGDYVYLMGDDDLVSPDFVNIIFRLIEKGYHVIHFNKLEGDDKCSNNKLFHRDFTELEKKYMAPDFIRAMLWRPNFMSSIIFSRQVWSVGLSDELKNMYGYRFLGRVYNGALIQNVPCCYYYMPILIMRNPQRSWSVNFPLYWFVGMSNIFKYLDHKLPGIYNQWCQYIHTEKQFHFVQNLSAVHLNKTQYKLKRDEFFVHLNKLQRFTYDFHLSPFSCKLTRGLFYLLLKLIYRE